VGTQLERQAMSRTSRGSPSGSASSSSGIILPRPPSHECPIRSHASSAGIRRASGVKPQPTQSTPSPVVSTPDPIIGGPDETRSVLHRRQDQTEGEVVTPRYSGIAVVDFLGTTCCQPVT
jgi:hypothetical protein